MTPKRFDPRQFIDREFEQELFEELLQRGDEARILAIKGAGGMGKSHLLHHFQYRCRTVKPRTPTSLVALDQLPDDSPLVLVQQFAQDLAAFGFDFPTFTFYETARKAHDFTTIRGSVDLRGADLRQARLEVSGVLTKIEQAGPVTIGGGPPTLTPEQQREAHTVSVRAFLQDLAAICQQQPVVLMLDAYERCQPELRRWLIDHLLEHHCFNLERRPAHLLLVLAGRELPEFDLYWSREDCQAVVKSIRSLSRWQSRHVEACLKLHGYAYNQQQLATFSGMVEIGVPPSEVIRMMSLVFSAQVRG